LPLVSTPPDSNNMSFLDIQQQQRLEQSPSSHKAKLSIREIQEQEEALQREEEFLKWWALEEERIRREQMSEEKTERSEAKELKSRERVGRRARGEKDGRGGRGRSSKTTLLIVRQLVTHPNCL